MANMVTPDAISTVLTIPAPDSSSGVTDLVVQVVDLKATGNRYTFTANDGKMKLKAILQSTLSSEVRSGKIQNLGLVRILDYTLNDIPTKNEKYLIVTKCEAVSPPLHSEVKIEVESEEVSTNLNPKHEIEINSELNRGGAGIMLKPKQEMITKSAAQIIHEQNGNAAPSSRMAMTRRVHPLVSLNPYQGNWTIKVRLTNKGNLRNYTNARGAGCVFNVELTDDDGTQIQATMFNEAAKNFYDRFQVGKVYYISKGMLKVANKQFKTVQNDYEMTLNENSIVEEATDEPAFVPEMKFNFVPIDQLGPYVNQRELIDVIGVVQSVSPTMSIRRKINDETIPKRDIVMADDTKKTVVVSLWGDLATGVGQELLDIADKAPIIAIKSLKVGDFQGVSLSTLSRSTIVVNPAVPEATKLKSWYDSEGKDTSMAPIGSGSSPSTINSNRSMYSDRVTLSHITSNLSLGEDKPVFFSVRAYISLIKPDQNMWYRACKTCNKKVTEAFDTGYWCEGCQKNDKECNLRYIMVTRASDSSGEAYISAFSEQAEMLIGCSADELNKMRSQEGDGNENFQKKLKEATWVPHLLRVSVTTQEYNSEKRQRITVRSVTPVDYAAESRFLLEDISKIKVSQQ